MQKGFRLVFLLSLISGCEIKLDYGGVGSGGNDPQTVTSPVVAEFPMLGYPIAVQRVWKSGQPQLLIARGIPEPVTLTLTREFFFERTLQTIAPISNPIDFVDETPVSLSLKKYTDQLLGGELVGFRFNQGISGIGLLAAPEQQRVEGVFDNLGTRNTLPTQTWSSVAETTVRKSKVWISFETPGPVVYVDALKTHGEQTPLSSLPLAEAQKVNAPQMRLEIATDRLKLRPLKPQNSKHRFKVQFEVSKDVGPHLEQVELLVCRQENAGGCSNSENVIRAVWVGP